MKHKTILAIILMISIVMFIAGTLFVYPEILFSCEQDIVEFGYCPAPYAFSFGEPLFYSSISLFIITLILIFLRKKVFTAWWKFAIWFIPLSIIWIALTPAQPQTGFLTWIGGELDREIVTWITSGAFLIISLIIILVKALKRRA